MKVPVRLFLLVVLLLAACSTPVGHAANSTATVAPSLTAQPTGAPSAAPTITLNPSPTAQPLPTRVNPIPATATPLPPGATPPPTKTPEKSFIDQYLPGRQKVAETAHFIFYVNDGYLPVEKDWWVAQAEQLYAYDSQRLQGAQVKQKISISFLPPETRSCPVRGLAAQGSQPTIILYADKSATPVYLQAVMAHEIAHAINADFPEGLPGSLALTEGLATWTAGKYWDAWKNVPTLDDLIREYIRQGTYEPIHENYDLHGIYPWQKDNGSSQDCLARRDKVYSEWADFLGYLINTYGWEKAHQLFKNPAPQTKDGKVIEYPPDYEGIYGKSLNQLEWEWLQKLQAVNS